MATTNESLLAQIELNTSKAVAGLNEAISGLREYATTADRVSKAAQDDMDRAATEIVARTVDIRRSLEEYGKSAVQVSQMRIAGEIEEIRYLQSHLSMNGLLTESMKSQLAAATEARQAQALMAKEQDKTTLIQGLIRQQQTLKIAIQERGKTELQLADIQRVRELEKLNLMEADLAKEGRLTQAISDQIRSTKELINTNAAERAKAATPTDNPGPLPDLKPAAAGADKLALALLGVQAAVGLVKEGFHALKSVFDETVVEFLKSEDATKGLANMMAIMGSKDVKGATKSMRDFAEELSKTTVLEDDAAVKLLTQAKAMGLTDEMAKKLVKTSVDVAAAYGKTVPDAFDALAGSLRGQARELSRMDPALKDASEEALKAGKAIDYFGARLDGVGTAQVKTFTGSMMKMANDIGDIMKDVGEAIAVGLGFESGASSLSGFVAKFKEEMQFIKIALATDLKQVKTFFNEIATGIIGLIARTVGAQIAAVGIMTEWATKGVAAVKGIFSENAEPPAWMKVASTAIKDFGEQLKAFGVEQTDTFDPFKVALITTGDVAKEMADRADKVATSAIKAGTNIRDMLGHRGDAEGEKKALEELQKILAAIGMTASERSMNEEDKIISAYQKQAFELGKQLDTLQKLGLFQKNRLAIEQAFETMAANQARDLDEHRMKAYNEELKSVQTLGLEIQKNALSTDAFEKAELDNALKAIDLKEKKAKLDGSFEAVKDLLNLERERTQEGYKQKLNAEETAALTSMFQEAVRARQELSGFARTDYDLAVRASQVQIEQIDMMKQRLADQGRLTPILEEQLNAARKTSAEYANLKISELDKPLAQGAADLADALDRAGRDFGRALDVALTGSIPEFEELGRSLSNVTIEGLKIFTQQFRSLVIDPLGAIWTGFSSGDFRSLDAFSESVDKLKKGGANFENVTAVLKEGMLIAFQDGAAVLNNVLTGKWLQQIADLFISIADWPATLTKAFSELGTALQKIVGSLATALQQVVEKIPSIFQKLIEALPKIAQTIAAAIPKLIGAFAEAAPALVRGIMQVLPQLIEAIGFGIAKVIDKLPEIVDELLKGMPRVIQALFNAIPTIIDALIKAVPGIIKAIVENMPAIVSSFVQGILGALGEIVNTFINEFIAKGGAVKIMIELAKAVPLFYVAFVQGVMRGLADFFKNLFGGFHIDVPPELKDIGGKISTGFKNGLKAISGAGSQLFKVSDLTASANDPFQKQREEIAAVLKQGEQMMKGWWDQLKDIFAHWGAVLSDLWKKFMAMIDHWGAVLGDLWHQFLAVADHWGAVLGDLWHKFLAVADRWGEVLSDMWKKLLAVGDHWLEVAGQMAQKLIDGVIGAWRWVWDNVIHPIGQLVIDAFNWVKVHVTDPINDIITGAFQWAWDHVIHPISDIVVGAFNWAKINVIQPISDIIVSAFNWAKVHVIDPIADSVTNAFQWVNENVFGPFVKALESITGGGGGNGVLSDYYHKILGHAEGGIIEGSAAVPGDSGLNDRILAFVSPGEAVIPRSKMANPEIRALVEAILSNGMKVPRFAVGGMVPSSAPSIGSLNVGAGLTGAGGGRGSAPTITQQITMQMKFENVQIPDDKFIREKLMPSIKRELKRATLDGEGVIYRNGLRSGRT